MADIFRQPYGATPIDEDEKASLIPSLLTMDALDQFEYTNILEARKWAFASRRLPTLDLISEPFVRDLHRRMFRHTWRWAGVYRKSEKTIGVATHRILTDLAILLGDADYWRAERTYPVHEIAVRFHHRLVTIHPFSNGNGRHARLVADLFVAQSHDRPLGWGANRRPADVERRAYLDALRKADRGNYSDLLAFAT